MTLLAKDKVSESTLQVEATNGELAGSILAWMAPRILAAVTSAVSKQRAANKARSDSDAAKKHKSADTRKAYDDAVKALMKRHKGRTYPQGWSKENGKTISAELRTEIAAVSAEIEGKQNEMASKEKTLQEKDPRYNELLEKQGKGTLTDEEKIELNQLVQDLEKLSKDREKLKGEKSVLESLKTDLENWKKQLDEAIRLLEKHLLNDDLTLNSGADYAVNPTLDAIRNCVVSPLTELLPEITAIVVSVTLQTKLRETLSGLKMGGVSIASENSNVNIRAKEPVSVHSERGILLDTKLSGGDAEKWGIASKAMGVQKLNPPPPPATGLPPKWHYKNSGVVAGEPGKDYIVAHTDTLGLFADNVRATTGRQWVSVAPLHQLKSSDAAEPNARLAVMDAPNGSIAATVDAGGTIVLQRGDANNGQSLKLEGDECVLQNGPDVKLTLEADSAQLATQKSWVIVSPEGAIISGKSSYILCNENGIILEPRVDTKPVIVAGFQFKRSNLRAAGGIVELGPGSEIKITGVPDNAIAAAQRQAEAAIERAEDVTRELQTEIKNKIETT